MVRNMLWSHPDFCFLSNISEGRKSFSVWLVFTWQRVHSSGCLSWLSHNMWCFQCFFFFFSLTQVTKSPSAVLVLGLKLIVILLYLTEQKVQTLHILQSVVVDTLEIFLSFMSGFRWETTVFMVNMKLYFCYLNIKTGDIIPGGTNNEDFYSLTLCMFGAHFLHIYSTDIKVVSIFLCE